MLDNWNVLLYLLVSSGPTQLLLYSLTVLLTYQPNYILFSSLFHTISVLFMPVLNGVNFPEMALKGMSQKRPRFCNFRPKSSVISVACTF